MKKKDLMTELREASVAELNERLTNLKSELFNLRFQSAVNQLENHMRLKAVKKEIARVQTMLTERAAAESAKQ